MHISCAFKMRRPSLHRFLHSTVTIKRIIRNYILITSETQTMNIMDCSPGQNNSGWCIAIISKGLSSLLLLGGSGGVDPIILKFECPKMRFPAFWALN